MIQCSCKEQSGVHIIQHNKNTCEIYVEKKKEFDKYKTVSEVN